MRPLKTTLLFLAFLGTSPLAAQTGPGADSFVICGQPYDAAHPWSWHALRERYAAEIQSGDFRSVYLQLGKAFALSPHQTRPGVRRAVADRIDQILSGAAGARQELEISSVLDPSSGLRRLVLFSGDERIDLTDCGPGGQRKAELDELRYLAHALVSLSDLELAAVRGAAFQRLEELEEQYDRYLFAGFPMFPWEALVNSLLTPADFTSGPPCHQIVFFHPGAGAEVSPDQVTSDGWRPVLSLEPLGWIYYPPSREHESWWGASALATFRDDRGYGLGAVFHYRNYSLGAAWHDDGQGGNDLQIFLGVDLFQFVDRQRRRFQALKSAPGTVGK